MFETTQELKDFILWCHSVKIKTIKVGNTEVQFSDLAFLDSLTDLGTDMPLKANEERDTSQTLVDAAPKPNEAEDEDMLFWSAKA